MSDSLPISYRQTFVANTKITSDIYIQKTSWILKRKELKKQIQQQEKSEWVSFLDIKS